MIKFTILALLSVQVAFAQSAPQSANQIQSQLPNQTTTSNYNLTAGFKSYNTPARERELDEPQGIRFKSKNEVSLGLKNAGGFGLSAMIVETLETRGLAKLNKFAPQDPSLTFAHPIFKNDQFKITGAYRQYFPVSDRSVTNNTWQHAYYLYVTTKLPNQLEWQNIITPRYFTQNRYKATDTTFYAENWSLLTKQFENLKWLRVGAGMHQQFEVHAANPSGFVMDVYPLIDIMVSNQIYLGPRFYFPVIVSGNVASAAKSASLSEVQAEFYFQASL